MGEVVGPSEEGEMLVGPRGHLVHPLPPGQSTTGMSAQPCPIRPGTRGEAVVILIIINVIVTIMCKVLNIVSGSQKVLNGHCYYNDISSFQALTVYEAF